MLSIPWTAPKTWCPTPEVISNIFLGWRVLFVVRFDEFRLFRLPRYVLSDFHCSTHAPLHVYLFL